jgi:zinc transporter ZupT
MMVTARPSGGGGGGGGRRQAARGRAASAESSSSESRTVADGGGAGGLSARAASAACMNLAADGVHDFCDGLAVGAGYGVSPAAGVATTVGVVLHEIPQELGDYMMLGRGGFSPSGAIAANFACGLAALLGTAVSLRVGEGFGKVLLPLCAGGLLFMAIGAVLPEMFEAVSDGGREGGVVRAVVAAVFGVAGVMVVHGIEAEAHGLGGHAH